MIGAALAVFILLAILIWALLAVPNSGLEGLGGESLATGAGTGQGSMSDGDDSSTSPRVAEQPASDGTESVNPQVPEVTQPELVEVKPIPISVEPADPLPEAKPLGFTGIKRPGNPPEAQPSDPPPALGGGGRGASGAGGGTGKSNAGRDPGARGDISFTLTWSFDTARQGPNLNGKGPDIDMFVDEPGGHRLNTSQEPFTSLLGPTPTGGQIDIDDRGGHGPGRGGGGPERAFWPKGQAPKGDFRFGVRWFEGVGKARYVFRVYLGDKLHIEKTGLLTEHNRGQAIELGTVTID